MSAGAWWVGGYTADMEGEGSGIGVLVPGERGELRWSHLAADTPSPTWLAPRGDVLYAAAEGAGRVEAFRVTGAELTPIGGVPAGGGWTCHLDFLDHALVAANYADGTLGVIDLDGDGAPTALAQQLEAEGDGPHEEQDGPHAHAAFRLDATTLLSADLGADRVRIHRIHGDRLERTGELALPPGTGPRDIVRHPSGHLLVLGELAATMTLLAWSGHDLEVLDHIALPGSRERDQAAAIALLDGGRRLFAGLRGSNRVAIVDIVDAGRRLEPVTHVSTEGDWPRFLTLDEAAAGGPIIHIANQRSSTVASLRIGADGIPRPVADPTPVPSPTHLVPLG